MHGVNAWGAAIHVHHPQLQAQIVVRPHQWVIMCAGECGEPLWVHARAQLAGTVRLAGNSCARCVRQTDTHFSLAANSPLQAPGLRSCMTSVVKGRASLPGTSIFQDAPWPTALLQLSGLTRNPTPTPCSARYLHACTAPHRPLPAAQAAAATCLTPRAPAWPLPPPAPLAWPPPWPGVSTVFGAASQRLPPSPPPGGVAPAAGWGWGAAGVPGPPAPPAWPPQSRSTRPAGPALQPTQVGSVSARGARPSSSVLRRARPSCLPALHLGCLPRAPEGGPGRPLGRRTLCRRFVGALGCERPPARQPPISVPQSTATRARAAAPPPTPHTPAHLAGYTCR